MQPIIDYIATLGNDISGINQVFELPSFYPFEANYVGPTVEVGIIVHRYDGFSDKTSEFLDRAWPSWIYYWKIYSKGKFRNSERSRCAVGGHVGSL